MIVDQLFTSSVVQTSTRQFFIESRNTYNLWESAGRKLMEAQLTQDQINQIFQYVQNIETAGGTNRTMLGKGKDAAGIAAGATMGAAGAVSKAWETLKGKVATSGPIKGIDKYYDVAAEKLKQATGGDQGVMKYVEKYRAFAKAHPVAQSLIYSALIAAAGISGAGLGGAAALGLFKLVDKLLQGEKFSSAAYQGAKTGAMAYGASKVGDLFRGAPQGAPDAGAIAPDAAVAADAANNINVDALQNLSSDPNLSPVAQKLAADLAAGKDITGAGEYLRKALDGAARKASMMGDMPDGSANAGMRQFMSLQNLMKAADGHPALMKESVNLTERQIFLLIGKIVERQRKLDEGIIDTVKGATGKAMNWAKTKGTNLTTKITADKLLQAWKKADSPTDSLDVAKVIQSAGVPSASIKQVYNTMKIPFAGEPGAGENTARKIDVEPLSVAPGAGAPTNPETPATGATPTSAPAKASGGETSLRYGINPANGKSFTATELQNRAAARSEPAATTAEPEATPAVTPTAQEPAEPTIAQIRQQKQAAAAKAAQDQMAGGPVTPTPAATPTPSALPQPTTVGQPKVTYGKGFEKFMQPKPTTQFSNFGTAGTAPAYKTAPAPNSKTTAQTTANLPAGGGTGLKAAADSEKRLSSDEFIKLINPPVTPESRVFNALKKPVVEMLQMVETKQDVQRIKQFVDDTFVKYGAVTESAFVVRNRLIEHVTQVGAQRRREYARKS